MCGGRPSLQTFVEDDVHGTPFLRSRVRWMNCGGTSTTFQASASSSMRASPCSCTNPYESGTTTGKSAALGAADTAVLSILTTVWADESPW